MQMIVVGAGGLGRECLDTVLATGRAVDALVDERRAGEQVRGLAVLAPDQVPAEFEFVVGIADPAVRRRLVQELVSRGGRPATVVHPTATVAPDSQVGAGGVVLGGAYVSSSVTIGEHAIVYYNATIGHDAGARSTTSASTPAPTSPAASGSSPDATVGSGAVVLQGRTVGRGAFVGAGAVVTRDVAPGPWWWGTPPHSCAERASRNQRTVASSPVRSGVGWASGNRLVSRVGVGLRVVHVAGPRRGVLDGQRRARARPRARRSARRARSGCRRRG